MLSKSQVVKSGREAKTAQIKWGLCSAEKDADFGKDESRFYHHW